MFGRVKQIWLEVKVIWLFSQNLNSIIHLASTMQKMVMCANARPKITSQLSTVQICSVFVPSANCLGFQGVAEEHSMKELPTAPQCLLQLRVLKLGIFDWRVDKVQPVTAVEQRSKRVSFGSFGL